MVNLVSRFSNSDFSGEIYVDNDIYTVSGQLSILVPAGQTLRYWAAAPIERRQSLVGSGLPFATELQAMENTPNQGSIPITDGSFKFSVRSPSAYYTCQANILNAPSVNFVLEPLNRQYTLVLGAGAPDRSLVSLPGYPNRATYR